MSIIPCDKNDQLTELINEYSEILKTEAHKLGNHGLSEDEFYNAGLFRGAIERIRGQYSATMNQKREFARDILNYMQDTGHILNWTSSGAANRHDYVVTMSSGRVSAIELKGCLDGNNTTIFDRPANAQEFIIWSVCTNGGADPKKNAWSGIHTRLSAEIVSQQKPVDGLVIWDMVCGTIGRPCPKVMQDPGRLTTVTHFQLPPPCIYVFPATIASVRNNPHPVAQSIEDVHLLMAFQNCFNGRDHEVNYVDFDLQHAGAETMRRTRIRRGGELIRESRFTAIRRS